MGLIEKALCKLFPFVDIYRDDTTDIYLRRFFIYPRDKDFGKNKGKGRIYLHKFYRGDEDPHCHSHPWPFTSLILTRGYFEETPGSQPIDPNIELDDIREDSYYERDGVTYRRYFYPRFSTLRRPSTWQHRVILKDDKPVWTIVKTGVKERSWGFWMKGKMCPWREYDNGNCLVEPKGVNLGT